MSSLVVSVHQEFPVLQDTTPVRTVSERGNYPRLQIPPQNILIGGLQGSGKGTLSTLLADREKISPYESSAQMRAHHTYAAISEDMANGRLVSQERVMVIVNEFLSNRHKYADTLQNGSKAEALRIAFDGMPRTLGQKQDFDNLLEAYKREPAWAVQLVLNKDSQTADDIARASIRFRVRRDQARGNARPDDTDAQKIERRIQSYHQETEPLFEKYGEDDRLIQVDAQPSFSYDELDVEDTTTFQQSIDAIYQRLVEALNSRDR